MVAVITPHVSRLTRTRSQQAVQRGDGFLPGGQDLAQVRLRLFQRGLVGFARGDVLLQRGLHLRFGRLRINRLLQRFGFRAGRAEEPAAPLLGLVVRLRVVAAPAGRARTCRGPCR